MATIIICLLAVWCVVLWLTYAGTAVVLAVRRCWHSACQAVAVSGVSFLLAAILSAKVGYY